MNKSGRTRTRNRKRCSVDNQNIELISQLRGGGGGGGGEEEVEGNQEQETTMDHKMISAKKKRKKKKKHSKEEQRIKEIETTMKERGKQKQSKEIKQLNSSPNNDNNKNDNTNERTNWTIKKTSKTTKSTGGGKQGECVRRIKHEWKQIIKLGIGYDWITKQTITMRGKKSLSGQEEINNDEHFYNYNYVRIGPFKNNLFHWHFSVQGPKYSVYENGIYHGRIILPKDYPGSPPRVQVLTPSGRFVTGSDICLSASAFHPETWTPRWTILSLVDALRMHMLTTANEIGGLHASDVNREKFASFSRSWKMGYVNHQKMVNDGLFCPPPILEAANNTLKEEYTEETLNKNNSSGSINSRGERTKISNEEKRQGDDEGVNEESVDREDYVTTTLDFVGVVTREAKKDATAIAQQSATVPNSNRKARLQRRPEKQKVIVNVLLGIIEFFRRHIEAGIIFVCILFFLRS